MTHLKRFHLWWKVALLCRYGDLIVPERIRGIGKERVIGRVWLQKK